MQTFGTRRVKNSSIRWMCLGIWKAKAQKAQIWSTFVRPCRRTRSHAIIRRRLVVRGAVAGSAIRMLRMKSGIHARCLRERRAAKRRTPNHESGPELPRALLAAVLLLCSVKQLTGRDALSLTSKPPKKKPFRVSGVEPFGNLDGQKQKIRDAG